MSHALALNGDSIGEIHEKLMEILPMKCAISNGLVCE